jgi:hypothetical protein
MNTRSHSTATNNNRPVLDPSIDDGTPAPLALADQSPTINVVQNVYAIPRRPRSILPTIISSPIKDAGTTNPPPPSLAPAPDASPPQPESPSVVAANAHHTTPTRSPPPPAAGASIFEVSSSLNSYAIESNGVSEMEAKAIGTAVISQGYMKRRRVIILDFITYLKSESTKYAYLLNMVPVPAAFPTTKKLIENLWVCFSGEENKRQKVVELNKMLINWVGNRKLKNANKLQKIGNAPFPQPSTLNMDLRAFFAGTKEYYLWSFGVSDFNFEGGYNGFFIKLVHERMAKYVSTPQSIFTIFIFHIKQSFLPSSSSLSIITTISLLHTSAEVWKEKQKLLSIRR